LVRLTEMSFQSAFLPADEKERLLGSVRSAQRDKAKPSGNLL
jgi:adenosine deaminase